MNKKNKRNKTTKKPEMILSLMKKHKLISGISVATFCLIVGLFTTLALEQARDNRVNTMEIADTKVEITEDFTSTETVKVDSSDASNITKKVTIDNKGETPVFVRAKIVPVIGRSGKPGDVADGTNDREKMLEETTVLPLVFTEGSASTGKDDVVIRGTSADWVKADQDDYYYYKKPLAANAKTTDLFNKVDLPMKNIRYLDEYKKQFFVNIEIKVEAITIYDSAFKDAWRWPEDNSTLTGNNKEIFDALSAESKKSK